MKTFTQIYKEVAKNIETPTLDYSEINGMLNSAMEEYFKYCFIPKCKRKLKSHHGVMIHIAKTHGMSTKGVIERAKLEYLKLS